MNPLAPRVALASLLAVAGCKGGSSPTPSAPAPASAAASAPLSPATPPSSSASAPRGPLISRATIENDLGKIAIPRHPGASPEGLRATADFIDRELRTSGYTTTRQPVERQGQRFDNVLAERRPDGARDPETVVLCAHHDAVAGTNGADDNGSGTAGLLAIARALSTTRLQRRLLIASYTLEEQGMLGSEAHVAALSPEERGRIVAVFNLEMIGFRSRAPGSQRYPKEVTTLLPGRALSTTGDFIGVLALSDASLGLAALESARSSVPSLKVESITLPRFVARLSPDLFRSDHASFWNAEIPAIFIGDSAEFRNPNYHQPSDRLETLDLDFAAEVSSWVMEAIRALIEEKTLPDPPQPDRRRLRPGRPLPLPEEGLVGAKKLGAAHLRAHPPGCIARLGDAQEIEHLRGDQLRMDRREKHPLKREEGLEFIHHPGPDLCPREQACSLRLIEHALLARRPPEQEAL